MQVIVYHSMCRAGAEVQRWCREERRYRGAGVLGAEVVQRCYKEGGHAKVQRCSGDE